MELVSYLPKSASSPVIKIFKCRDGGLMGHVEWMGT
jgi:hypothetical protein